MSRPPASTAPTPTTASCSTSAPVNGRLLVAARAARRTPAEAVDAGDPVNGRAVVGESSELVPATTGTTSNDATTSPGASSILRRGGVTDGLSGVNRARLPHGKCSLEVEARIP